MHAMPAMPHIITADASELLPILSVKFVVSTNLYTYTLLVGPVELSFLGTTDPGFAREALGAPCPVVCSFCVERH